MDLTGQAGSESIRHRQYSGTGGQVNFVTGANFSRGGKSIMSLNSTYKDKEGKLKSTIVPFIPPGTIVTTSRNDVEYIITEYGVVNLKYQGVSQRVKKMISISRGLRSDCKPSTKRSNRPCTCGRTRSGNNRSTNQLYKRWARAGRAAPDTTKAGAARADCTRARAVFD